MPVCRVLIFHPCVYALSVYLEISIIFRVYITHFFAALKPDTEIKDIRFSDLKFVIFPHWGLGVVGFPPLHRQHLHIRRQACRFFIVGKGSGAVPRLRLLYKDIGPVFLSLAVRLQQSGGPVFLGYRGIVVPIALIDRAVCFRRVEYPVGSVACGQDHLYRSVFGEIIAKTGLNIEVDITHIVIAQLTGLYTVRAVGGIVYHRILVSILFRLIRYELRKKGVGAETEVCERAAHIGQPSLCHKADR